MDLDHVLHYSRCFYREHQLDDWAAVIPERPFWPVERADILAEATKHGFKAGFAFPPFHLQMASLERLIEQTARKAASGVPDNQQYQVEPFFADTWSKTSNGKVLQRTDNLGPRVEGPYVLLFSPSPIAAAWGRTGRQMVELFEVKGWSGLTVTEYLVLQRWRCEQLGDHRFFDEPQDASLAHWIWLLDSGTDMDISAALGSVRGINIQACPATNRDSRRAAIGGLLLAMR